MHANNPLLKHIFLVFLPLFLVIGSRITHRLTSVCVSRIINIFNKKRVFVPKYEEDELWDMRVIDLRKICKNNKIRYGRMRKNELVDIIMETVEIDE
jgi:hypothetical protein